MMRVSLIEIRPGEIPGFFLQLGTTKAPDINSLGHPH